MTNTKDSLGDRMKNYYENRSKTFLTRRTPVIIRIDGKAFHTFTKGFDRPYDEVFHNAMNQTAKYLCENIQGCKIGYTQSDEITLLLTDYDTLTTEAWFDYNVQKMCSVAASMATMAFNKAFTKAFNEWEYDHSWDWNMGGTNQPVDEKLFKLCHTYDKALSKGAMFDARCFNIPKEEITNCFVGRQQDATRNAIEILGRCYFSDKQLFKKSCNDIQDMLMLEKNVNFNDMPTAFKRGVCIVKKRLPCTDRLVGYKTQWVIDKEIPIFSQQREYIEDILLDRKGKSDGDMCGSQNTCGCHK